MEKDVRIFIKLVAVIVLTALFIWLIYTDERVLQLKQPSGELIPASDVLILLKEFEQISGRQIDSGLLEKINGFSEAEEYLDYDTYMEILDCILGKEEQSYEKEKITYKDKYRGGFFLLKKDWYNSYEVILSSYGLTDFIRLETVEVLGGSELFTGEKILEDTHLLGKDGKVYTCLSKELMDLKYTKAKVYVRENRLLTLVEILPGKSVLENVWIMEDDGKNIRFFYEDYEVLGEYQHKDGDAYSLREQVGDISFQEGTILEVCVKSERISGKLLSISEGQFEIEGYGSIGIKENCIGYQLYEKLSKADRSDLSIGYDFADFVLENGKVCAFLITRKEEMETIRVAIKSNDFNSLYHDEIILTCQDPMTIFYGDYEQRKQEKVAPGQKIIISAGDEYLSGARMEIIPDVNTGKIQVLSLNRSQGTPSYRGSMEIAETKEGLVLINEVLLEEYLYSVVPSEMPASYPIEALKAQAICARTYGYRYLKQPGYAALGAHVDDSVGYQVYNNIAENVNSTKAVKETAGMLLLYEEEPVSTYYYSTSCGFGADAGVWNEDQKDQLPYLKAVHIAQEEGDYTAAELMEEDKFRAYITKTDKSAYEKEEPWFRWEYELDELDTALLFQRMEERYQAAPGKVLTFMGEDGEVENDQLFEEKEPKAFKKVYNIQCFKRKEGGVMDELLIETDKGTYKIVSEYNIRYVLNQGGEVIRQDGSSYESNTLLPSAYLTIDVVKAKESVVGYTISGGGYGHGVGMSQNGARAMGMEEMDCESILSFYFQDCRLDKIY